MRVIVGSTIGALTCIGIDDQKNGEVWDRRLTFKCLCGGRLETWQSEFERTPVEHCGCGTVPVVRRAKGRPMSGAYPRTKLNLSLNVSTIQELHLLSERWGLNVSRTVEKLVLAGMNKSAKD